MKSLLTLSLTGLMFTLTACSSVQSVSTVQKSHQTYNAFSIYDASQNPTQFNEQFKKTLEQQLKKYGYQTGTGLNIKFEVKDFDQGNRALRYLVGFGAGKATAKVNVALYDKDGNHLGDVNTDTSLSMGGFGGDANDMAGKAAKDIATKIHTSGILTK